MRFDAVVARLALRDALALFETVFADREVVFAAVRPRPLAPRVFAAAFARGRALRDAVRLDAVFFDARLFFAAVRPRPLAPPRDLGAAFFGVLAIRKLHLL
jgi:hypothetical protein